MPTRYNPQLLVRVNGALVATGDPTAALCAVDRLAVTWGRARVWDHQDAAQAKLTLLDRDFAYGPHIVSPALLGQAVTLSYAVPGVLAEKIFFRGTITEAAASVRPPDPATGNNRGQLLELAVASKVTNLANVRTSLVSANQSFLGRWSELSNLIYPSLLTGGATYNTTGSDVFGNVLNWSSRMVAARTYKDASVIDALREMLDMTSDRMVYDPAADRLSYAGRKVIDDPAGYAALVADVDGKRTLRAPGHLTVPTLDAGEFTAAKLTRSTEGSVTAIDVSRWSDATGATPGGGTRLVTDLAADPVAPVRMTVGTDWYSGTDAAQTAALWSSVITSESKRWMPEPITHLSKRVGGLTAEQVPLLLSGAEPAGYLYLAGSDWARAGAAPVFSIIGGTITYDGGDPGWWSPAVQLAAVYFRNGSAASLANARTAANCDTAATPLKVADLAECVSAADARFWTTPYTG